MMKFRSLLKMVPAASALFAMRSKGVPVPQTVFTSAGFAITVQCWSFKEFTLFEAIEMAAAAGVGGVELFPGQKLGGKYGELQFGPDLADEKIQAVAEHLQQNHLAALNYGVARIPKVEAEARKVFEMAEKLNLYGITTESLDSLDMLEKFAEEYDIKVCFHNHPKPTALWNPETVWEAIDGRHENIGYCADIGHWATSGLDPLEVIRKIAPRVRSFHMKDRELHDTWSHDRPFGTGVIDIFAILDEARKHGFAGNVSIEYEHNWGYNLPDIAQCVGYLRGYSMARA